MDTLDQKLLDHPDHQTILDYLSQQRWAMNRLSYRDAMLWAPEGRYEGFICYDLTTCHLLVLLEWLNILYNLQHKSRSHPWYLLLRLLECLS